MIVVAAVLLAIGVTTAFFSRHAIARTIALHEGKSAIAHHLATPVDLNDAVAHYGMPASHFAHVTDFPAWRTMPTGFQTYDHVPFQINGASFLWGAGCAKQLHIVFSEQIPDIPVNQKFETLYLLHCAFFASTRRTPVYQVVFHYEDDAVSPVTNLVLYGEDILDWYAGNSRRVIGPRGPNSRLAWVGGAVSPKNHNPLRLCLTAITNPAPDLKVTSIDLDSSKGESATCLLGMTTGRAGLLK